MNPLYNLRRISLKCSILLSLAFVFSLFVLHHFGNGLPRLFLVTPFSSYPLRLGLPQYRDIYEMERTLPQHNLDLEFPEGRTGRYVRFANQIAMLGWNNVLNEVLLCSHLAWRANRSYVFQDYIWKIEYFPWKVYGQVPRTPLNALIAGPTAGGPWSVDDPSPRAISDVWFHTVCPESEVISIDASQMKNPVRGKTADLVMDYWVDLLSNHPARCIEVVSGSGDDFPQTFDLWTVSTRLVLPIWEEFKKSPVSRLLRSPPLVNRAIASNEHLFFPEKTQAATLRYDAMMVLHLRRGDFVGACQGLADWNSTFYMWNLLPGLPDPLHVGPPVGEGIVGKNTPENYLIYKRRCMPSEEELVTKIMESKLDWESGVGMSTRPDFSPRRRERLSTLYISTNAEKKWIDQFKKRMIEEGWTTVVSSADLILNSEQTAVSMAVDMDIGRRAAVFIGNGWSSMTSNVVHRRLVDENDYISTRFW